MNWQPSDSLPRATDGTTNFNINSSPRTPKQNKKLSWQWPQLLSSPSPPRSSSLSPQPSQRPPMASVMTSSCRVPPAHPSSRPATPSTTPRPRQPQMQPTLAGNPIPSGAASTSLPPILTASLSPRRRASPMLSSSASTRAMLRLRARASSSSTVSIQGVLSRALRVCLLMTGIVGGQTGSLCTCYNDLYVLSVCVPMTTMLMSL
ncbi:hypothetical protein BKA67DRAFT_234938 [Truncatella angustata]|uniref:Uncharacterized protein n=1 Tax=Truncatella angustata TaxID=152316 RepID=A0A9P8UNJ8_9PEZI|nr:uncharacterized protein BKA67DRAFT_234938 [Truncatella angustata]KAH6655377.1 hypothetical protein BKA67DRAFT_234938 [Truncatella angustata]